MDRQCVAYPYNRILFSYKKEQSIDSFHNMDEPWKHFANFKKLVTKNHILYDSIYTICPE